MQILIPVLFLLLISCQSVPNVQTDGVRQLLPTAGMKVAVLCDHDCSYDKAIMTAAMQWLQGRGLRVVERSMLPQVLREQVRRLIYSPAADADALRVGRMLGVQQIIFAERDGAPTNWVTVRGVDLETGEQVWSGRAEQREWFQGKTAAELTELALEAAWGDRDTR